VSLRAARRRGWGEGGGARVHGFWGAPSGGAGGRRPGARARGAFGKAPRRGVGRIPRAPAPHPEPRRCALTPLCRARSSPRPARPPPATNPGEIPGNGVDDDGNGFVDDVQGWDFANGDNTVYDGSPNSELVDAHGTHVAGTIGAAGMNKLGVVGVCM
jgi:subtilisin family serine protease